MSLSSRSSTYTPWLADFCLAQISDKNAYTRTTGLSATCVPSKLVQIISRGGSFWRNDNLHDDRNINNDNTNQGDNSGTNAIRTGKNEAILVVTDGKHSIRVYLSMKCQDRFIEEYFYRTPPGSDPWLFFQRGNWGLIQSCQLQLQEANIYGKKKILSLVIDEWICRPDLLGVGGHVGNRNNHYNNNDNCYQPIMDYIPIRKVLYSMPEDGAKVVEAINLLGDPVTAMQDPELLQELMEMAADDNPGTSGSGSTTTTTTSNHRPSASHPHVDDESSDSDDDSNKGETHSRRRSKSQEVDDNNNNINHKGDDDDDDVASVKNLKDMLVADETDDETDLEGEDCPPPLETQPTTTRTTTTISNLLVVTAQAPPHPPQQEDDETHILLTQPSLTVGNDHSPPPSSSSKNKVDSSTQTAASRLKSHIGTLKMSIPSQRSTSSPLHYTIPLGQPEDAVTPHGRRRSGGSMTWSAGSQQSRTGDGTTPASSMQSRQSSKRRKMMTNTTPDDHHFSPSYYSATTLSYSPRIQTTVSSSSLWKQVCDQLNHSDKHSADDDPEKQDWITVDIHLPSKVVLRKRGGLSRWLHTNLTTTTTTIEGEEEEAVKDPLKSYRHRSRNYLPIPSPLSVLPPSSTGK